MITTSAVRGSPATRLSLGAVGAVHCAPDLASRSRSVSLQGKVAVVTGGGTGLGREVSRLFVERGANLAIVYSRSRDDAEKTARELARDGRKITTHQIDVADEARV